MGNVLFENESLEDYLEYIKHNKFVKPLSFREKFNVSEKEEKYWYVKVMDKLREKLFFETNMKGDNEYENFVLYKRKNENIQWICSGLGYTEDEVKFILYKVDRDRRSMQIRRKVKRDKRIDRIKELNYLIRIGRIQQEEIEELKELIKPKSEKEKFRLSDLSNNGINNISFYNRKDQISAKKNITYYVDEKNYVMTKDYVVENYLGGHEYNISKQIKPFNIVPISQSELLQNYKSYGMSADLYGEMYQLYKSHKKINIGNQVKPPKK
jgi:hypothetical protein